MTSPSRKLNVGCGGTPLDGWVSLDKHDYPHVDILYDLESGHQMQWRAKVTPYVPEGKWGYTVPDDTFDEIAMIHVVEHVQNILPCMQELWRVAKPGCRLSITCPYGSSDNADEDPTHVRRIYSNSFVYFSQCWYGKNSYGYTGDWELETAIFSIYRGMFTDKPGPEQRDLRIRTLRNVVDEFAAGLVAIKPARKPGFEPKAPRVRYRLV